MIGVLTLFGEIDLQPILNKIFIKNDLIFICDNCNTSVQLVDKVEEHYKETDVVIIASNAVNMENFNQLTAEIREKESRMNIILILNGNKEQYLESQLSEYKHNRINIIYDDNGFDTSSLVDLVKPGKLKKKEHATVTSWDIDKIPASGENAVQQVKRSIKKIGKNSIGEKKAEEKNTEEKIIPKDSFSKPKCKYTIGVFAVTHGAGATTVCINLAKYFSFHNYDTKLIDLSGNNALELVKLKSVDIGIGCEELSNFKRDSNILIIDFGTPYDLTPKGDNFKITSGYSPEYIREITKCNIKIILGFSDVWNIGKLKFFLNNEQWKEMIDDSFIFIIAGDDKKLKSEYPNVNIMNREDNYRDDILQVVREDEYL